MRTYIALALFLAGIALMFSNDLGGYGVVLMLIGVVI